MPGDRPRLETEERTAERLEGGSAGDIEDILGHSFADRDLLRAALTHGSVRQAGRAPGRLEFLGDAVLELIVREHLMRLHPGDGEGALTRYKAALVSEKALARAGRAAGIMDSVALGGGVSGGAVPDSVVAGVLEALIGAVFLDSGGNLEAAGRAVERTVLGTLEISAVEDRPPMDACSRLQELCQGMALGTPGYVSERAGGSDHAPVFVSRVEIAGMSFGPASGRSKKEAQQAAAAEALEALESEE
ncbi:ribonuclease III [Candidatus Fermentibacteria bacterium]|nr:ribonuclease III [Candidatus Fermentibacteria bacterium]